MESDSTCEFNYPFDQWELRVCMLISFSLQIVLIVFGSIRKTKKKTSFVILINGAYYLADWIAPYAIGLIPANQTCINSSTIDLQVFWAPFLLLHICTPDLKSLTPDDNEVWIKEVTDLILQIQALVIVFVRWSRPPSTLSASTMLVFIAGIIKYAERTRALYLGSLSGIEESLRTDEPNPGPDYDKLTQIYFEKKTANLQPEVLTMELAPPKEFKASAEAGNVGDLSSMSLLKHAYSLFETFTGFITSMTFGSKSRQFSREFFLKRTATEAFKLLELELSFIYETIHTNIVVVNSVVGYTCRFIVIGSIFSAFVLFILTDKGELDIFDIVLTYILLIGAIILELQSDLKLLIFSGRRVILLKNNWAKHIAAMIVNRRRWSESIRQTNFIGCCLRQRSVWANKVLAFLALKDVFDAFITSYLEPLTGDVKEVIFTELKIKSGFAKTLETVTKICSERGDWAVMRSSCYSQLKWSLGEVEFVESFLLWHIATEICYNTSENHDQEYADRRDCKIFSDYMFYLLVLNPDMMSTVAGDWNKVFLDTSAETRRFFQKKSVNNQKEACESILSVNTDIKPGILKGNVSKSVLFDACILAKQLKRLKNQWEIMSRVWVELLSYAAFHCEADVHAEQPSKGGELLTFVWLLMNHLGLGKQFHEENVQTKYKVVVKK